MTHRADKFGGQLGDGSLDSMEISNAMTLIGDAMTCALVHRSPSFVTLIFFSIYIYLSLSLLFLSSIHAKMAVNTLRTKIEGTNVVVVFTQSSTR